MGGQRGSAIGAGILEGAGGRRWEVRGEGLRARLGAAVGAVAAQGHGAGASGRGAAGAHVADHPTCRENGPLMHRAVPGSASPDSWRWEPREVGGIPREAPRSHRQSGSTDIPQSHTFTELCQAQPLPAEEGETPRWETAAPGGGGIPREAPRIHPGSTGIPVGHSRTELHQAQHPPARGEGEAPQRGIAAPGGVGSPGKHPGCIPDPWISRCAARVPPTLSQAPHPPAATSDGPTWDGDSRVYPGACRLGTRVGHPGIACRRNVGWELSGEVKSGGHRSYSCRSWLRACSTAGLPPHSSRGSPTAQPPMAQPPTALGCSQCSPSWHRDARSAAPPTGGDTSPLQD